MIAELLGNTLFTFYLLHSSFCIYFRRGGCLPCIARRATKGVVTTKTAC